MKKQKQISREEAQRIGEALHIDWNQIDSNNSARD